MDYMTPSTYLFLIMLLLVFTLHRADGVVICKASEREALFRFKDGVNDSGGMLSSWSSEADCCKWQGVSCDNQTGHVIKLHLPGDDIPFRDYSSRSLIGPINPSLMELKFLEYLDLSCNNFDGLMPKFLGSFKQLRYLNLSLSFQMGGLPLQLGNLSNLQVLDLSSIGGDVHGGNCEWLSKLSSLRYLNLEGIDLSKVTNLFQILNDHVPSISYININYCYLSRTSLPSSFSHVNFTMLTHIEVKLNSLEFKSPHWLSNITSLEYIDLSYNLLVEDAQGMLMNLCNLNTIKLAYLQITANLEDLLQQCDRRMDLIHLDLTDNNITGNLPEWLGSYKSLIGLNLYDNQLSGEIPESIGQLCMLTDLQLDSNHLQGIVTEKHFSCFSQLTFLSLSSNSLERVSPHWIPPFKNLFSLSLLSCKVGPKFPPWIQILKSLRYLELPNTSMAGVLPHWIWSFSPKLYYVDLSMNGITGAIPHINGSLLRFVLLQSNKISGPFPNISSRLFTLSLSNNSFSGPITFYGQIIYELDLSMNYFNGTIPSTLCTFSSFIRLDLSNNNLSGQIPECLGLQNSWGDTCYLNSLHLNNNNLEGTLPESLKNCRNMSILDGGENRFIGSIPTWIATNMLQLKVLRLRSNLFSGNIPHELSDLSMLQVLDLANNNLSGTIPITFGNFSAMKVKHPQAMLPIFEYDFNYNEKILVELKGQGLPFDLTLILLTSMDLSTNKLHGEIPRELGDLQGLINLNLSGNSLSGGIPNSLSNISQLESLDLSSNNLSGNIPETFTILNSLSFFNVSFNNLSGKIPTEGQFGTFSSASYLDDPHLCGMPLSACVIKQGSSIKNHELSNGSNDRDRLWVFVTMISGFVFGFWIFWGPLLLKKNWRYAYFCWMDKFCGRFYKFVNLCDQIKRKV